MKNNHHAAKRRLLLATMILVPFIPFITVLAIGYSCFTASLENSTVASLKRIVSDHCHMIDTFLAERTADLQVALFAFGYDEVLAPATMDRVFTLLQKRSPAFVDLGVFDAKGIHVSYRGSYQLAGRDYSNEPWFREVMEKGTYISDVFLGFRRVPHFIIAVARSEGGERWVMRATIDPYTFNELVESVRIGRTGEAYLLNHRGVFQTRRRSGGKLLETDAGAGGFPQVESGITSFVQTDGTGAEHLYATTRLRNKDWLLVARLEKADAFRALSQAGYLILIISVIGGAVIVLAAFSLAGWMTRRMERIDTEKDQLGQQLIRASRLAELGEMAAGFAHEINNPLQIIKSEHALITMILEELKERGELGVSEDVREIQDSLGQIDIQLERSARITQAILKFGRQGEPRLQRIDLGRFIPEVTAMVEKKADVSGVAFRQAIAPGLPPVEADPAQLQQVLLNLYNNALDAVAERHGARGGEITVEAGPRDGGVEIRVADNGCGISPENLKRVFAPFFTTKPVGKGTGLGLSVCYGIVERLGGQMAVESEPNAGTRFTIRLPAAAGKEMQSN